MLKLFVRPVTTPLWVLMLACGSAFAGPDASQDSKVKRPTIWMQEEDKAPLLAMIRKEGWAKSRFSQLRDRADDAVAHGLDARDAAVKKLPIQWASDSSKFPAFIPQNNVGNNHLRNPLQLGLQQAVDCSILYYLTEDDQYGQCAGDILYNVVKALNSTPVDVAPSKNNGWIVAKNHLLESRIYGAQIPLIYDFAYGYFAKGGHVYDGYRQREVEFDFDAAQYVFETYVKLALNAGLVDNNWPVLEASSLLNNTLAIDDPVLREQYLAYTLSKDTEHQDSLAKVAKSFKNEGDIWPESINYSLHVSYFSLYLMTALDRIDPSLRLGQRYPNIGAALLTFEQLRYPNGDYPAFGDGNRQYSPDYFEYELALTSAVINENTKSSQAFAAKLQKAMKTGDYDRGHLAGHSTKAAPYYAPLELLWGIPRKTLKKKAKVEQQDALFTIYPSYHIPFAGFFVQRNVNTKDPVKHALVAAAGGGSYVHGHASGIDLELYGKGTVLATEAGKSTYTSEVHHQYHRLFAGHNTVISNGASASKGDWINLGINTVEKVAMEPQPATSAISDNHSFATLSFYDEYNLVAPAQHERTTALLRLSDEVGYFVDVFRAKSDTPNQFHDYLYRNIGENLKATSIGKRLEVEDDRQRYQAAASLPKQYHKQYQHPGWHFFTDVKTAANTTAPIEVMFTAKKLPQSPVGMHAYIVPGLETAFTQARVPKAKIAPKPYHKKTLPIMVLRHQGEAWSNPFAVVYEPFEGKGSGVVTSTERLMQSGVFKGIKINASLKGKAIEQYVLMQENAEDELRLEGVDITFKGRFGVVTLVNGQLDNLYVGDGQRLVYQDQRLVLNNESAGYKTFRDAL